MSDRDQNVECDRFPGYPETERESRCECDERQWDAMSDQSCDAFIERWMENGGHGWLMELASAVARADQAEQHKLVAEIIADMRGYLEISGIRVSKPRRVTDQADGLRHAMMGIARSQGALAAEMVHSEGRAS